MWIKNQILSLCTAFLLVVVASAAENKDLTLNGQQFLKEHLGEEKVVRVAVLADIHLNMSYSERCGLPTCRDRGTYDMDGPIELIQ